MGAVQPYFIWAVLFSLHCLNSETNLQGLTCVNDFINNVTCTLNGFSADPGLDCEIFGYKKIRIRKNEATHAILINQSCKVRGRRDSPPGCSFFFENREFTYFEVLPRIIMECDGALVENLKDYKPKNHIKMHPPGPPNVTHTENGTVIYWDPGSPRSVLFRRFEYEVQIQNPLTKEVRTFPSDNPQLKIAAGQLKGKQRVRVKVKPAQSEGSQWSEWSPFASWGVPGPANRGWSLDWTFIILAVLIILCVMIIMMLVFYRCSISKRYLKVKPVPNPSKYFQTLNSGNLKKWLNPNCAPPTLDNKQPVDHISPVEVCESWAAGPPAFNPPSSNCAPQPPINIEPSAGPDANRLVDNLSQSSSCFSNLGYFVSTSSGSSVQTQPNSVNFAEKCDFHILQKTHNTNLPLSLRLAPALAKSPSCESLKGGPQSPDSGFCFGTEDVEVEEGKQDSNLVEDQISGPCSSSHPSLPLRLLVQTGNPSTPSGLSQLSSDRSQMHAPMLAANISATGWPVACTTYRPSSMPVESSKSGYFILQEIQTTSSNASI
ncbi:interleukin-2 receptor subunit beta [Syngnathoides biaculeatus]|uniref:interleukin-2 receptor subunit beta n=1 Tax=Syngnathoides biaculeatus TaxID=300417 RepID=UPI002ADD7BFA|nr:interleukin-2 receptor subunit beta [Syngnathoides biaculeatus]